MKYGRRIAYAGVSKILGLLIVFTLFAPILFAQAQAAPTSSDKAAPATQEKTGSGKAEPSASDYVGSETCKTCHADVFSSWEKTAHWQTTLDTKGGPSRQGCEGCHGPGAAHVVAGGGDKTKIFVFEQHSAKEINARCLSCHAGGTQHMNALNSLHSRADEGIFAGEVPAGTLLWVPPAAEAAVRNAVPSSC
jgi:hypothetical protein